MDKPLIHVIEKNNLLPSVYGEHNAHLKLIEKNLDVVITVKGNECHIKGTLKAANKAITILQALEEIAKKGQNPDEGDVKALLRFDDLGSEKETVMANLEIETKKRNIRPRSPRQAQLIEDVRNHDMVFALGPAGTGKTYLAVALAVEMFLSGTVERIVFCRPAVEAGERLGFLPGDMEEKIAPYLRPMYDALFDMMPADRIERSKKSGEIEIAPLGFMRGRTLNNAAIVLDEAQNTTSLQMKMFLTRLGNNSKMIISGDPSQADLPPTVKSGLKEAHEILEGIKDISFIQFTNEDVIRHDLVQKVLNAYDKS